MTHERFGSVRVGKSAVKRRGQGGSAMDVPRDVDPVETREWREALGSVLEFEGSERAHFLLSEIVAEARRQGAPVPYSANTPYLNTIPPEKEERHPGHRATEHRIRSLVRWNAVAI